MAWTVLVSLTLACQCFIKNLLPYPAFLLRPFPQSLDSAKPFSPTRSCNQLRDISTIFFQRLRQKGINESSLHVFETRLHRRRACVLAHRGSLAASFRSICVPDHPHRKQTN